MKIPHIIKKRFIRYANMCLEGGYSISKDSKPAIQKIFSTFLDTKYGLIVCGATGTGKTLMFEILRRVIHPQDALSFKIVSCLDVVREFNISGHESFNTYRFGNILFDDLGTEDRGVYYGDRVEVMEKLIQFRYNAFRANGSRTSFTTNLDATSIGNRYGARCQSRLREMCEQVVLNFGDKRHLKNFIEFKKLDFPRILSKEDREYLEAYKRMMDDAKNFVPPKSLTLGQRVKQALGVENFTELKKST